MGNGNAGARQTNMVLEKFDQIANLGLSGSELSSHPFDKDPVWDTCLEYCICDDASLRSHHMARFIAGLLGVRSRKDVRVPSSVRVLVKSVKNYREACQFASDIGGLM